MPMIPLFSPAPLNHTSNYSSTDPKGIKYSLANPGKRSKPDYSESNKLKLKVIRYIRRLKITPKASLVNQPSIYYTNQISESPQAIHVRWIPPQQL